MVVSLDVRKEIENNKEIFRYLSPDSNDLLTRMSNSDRLQMIFLLKQYYLELRNRLGLSKDITFGLEIEFGDSNRKAIESELAKVNTAGTWKVVDDGSCDGEINTPKLTDTENSWIDLSTVCNIVDRNASVLDCVGGHIHIGMQILGNNPKYWANFAKLWAAYENVIYRFLYGEFVSPRSGIIEQACPISREVISDLDRIEDRAKMGSTCYMLKLLDKDKKRKRCVNLTNISDIEPYKYGRIENKNTIEFRGPNGTFDPVIWQNNVNLLVHLFLYAKSEQFDEECINRRISSLKENDTLFNLSRYLELKDRCDISLDDMFYFTGMNKYSYIYQEQAMELADLIFTNNLDKMYFLRQYIKSGEVSTKPLVRGSCFTATRALRQR